MNLLKSRYARQLTEIMNQVKQYAENPFVQQFIDLPQVSQLRIQLLYLFLQEQQVPEDKIQQYCVSATLIQMGLDSHEDVPLESNHSVRDERFRQLLVLSGDYYSSRYYDLLAKVEDTETIKLLASSIQSINEAKINLYSRRKQNKISENHYLNYINFIDTNLYVSIINRYPSQMGQAWTNLLRQLVLVERLWNEYRTFQWEKKVQGYLSILDQHMDVHRSVQKLILKIRELLHHSQEMTQRITSQETREEIMLVIQEYFRQIDLVPSRIAEEM